MEMKATKLLKIVHTHTLNNFGNTILQGLYLGLLAYNVHNHTVLHNSNYIKNMQMLCLHNIMLSL